MGVKLDVLKQKFKALTGANMMNAKAHAEAFAAAAVEHAEHMESALRQAHEDRAKLAAEVKRMRDVVAELCNKNGMPGALQ